MLRSLNLLVQLNGGVKEDGADGVRNPKDKNFKKAAAAGLSNAKDVNNLEEVAVEAVTGEEEVAAGVRNHRDGVSNGTARARARRGPQLLVLVPRVAVRV